MIMASYVLLAFTAAGCAFYVMSMLALVVYKIKKECGKPCCGHLKVSVLKPVSGVDAEIEDNLLSFLAQDYEDYEVLFGVLEPDDPAAAIISDIVAGHSNVSLYIGSCIDGANNKVRILHNLAAHANGEIMVITDADTRVTADFLSRITTPFADQSTGAVTCFYKGANAKTTADKLECLYYTCVFETGVALSALFSEVDFCLGAAVAVRRSVLDKIGGFESMVDYLADDFQLGRSVVRAGCKVKFSDYVIDIVLGGDGLRAVLARELRWLRTVRVSRAWGHAGLIFTFGFAFSLLYLASAGFAAIGWAAFVMLMIIRQLTAFVGAYYCLEDRGYISRAYLLPLRDIISFFVWGLSFLSRTVCWRGRVLVIQPGGKLSEAGKRERRL